MMQKSSILRVVAPRIVAGLATLAAVAVVPASPARAADPTALGSFGDWAAFTFDESGKKVCYMSSQPAKSAPRNVRRGLVYTLLTHRPAEKTTDVVSVIVGYPFRKGSDATVTIDGKTFSLFTDGETAWARDPDTDHALAQAIKSGSSMVVTGRSQRGTATTDTYSLKGSAAAYEAIGDACGVK